jgi:hypothetical protein
VPRFTSGWDLSFTDDATSTPRRRSRRRSSASPARTTGSPSSISRICRSLPLFPLRGRRVLPLRRRLPHPPQSAATQSAPVRPSSRPPPSLPSYSARPLTPLPYVRVLRRRWMRRTRFGTCISSPPRRWPPQASACGTSRLRYATLLVHAQVREHRTSFPAPSLRRSYPF